MSRVMTMSELYALMLSDQAMTKPAGASVREKNPLPTPTALNERVPMLWVNPTRQRDVAATTTPPAAQQADVAPALRQAVAEIAAACGISASDAWTEAAGMWIAQRQRDMEDLASPAGQTLATTVTRVWSVIDDQMRELRGETARLS